MVLRVASHCRSVSLMNVWPVIYFNSSSTLQVRIEDQSPFAKPSKHLGDWPQLSPACPASSGASEPKIGHQHQRETSRWLDHGLDLHEHPSSDDLMFPLHHLSTICGNGEPKPTTLPRYSSSSSSSQSSSSSSWCRARKESFIQA